MRSVAIGLLAAALLLAGCGGTSAGSAASLYESQYGAENVVCKEISPADWFGCTTHRNGKARARTEIKVESGNVTVQRCEAINLQSGGEPCAKIGVPGDEAVMTE